MPSDPRTSAVASPTGSSHDDEPLPSVSVVIPTRDRPVLMRRAVEAVLAQRYEGEVECLVVFDQSDPELPDVDIPPGRRLKALRNERTPGLAGARNTGAMAATGELLAS